MLLCKKQCRNPYVHGDLNARQYAFNPRRRSVRIDKGAGDRTGVNSAFRVFFLLRKKKNSSRFIAERAGLTLLIYPASSFPCLFERERFEIMPDSVRNFAPLEALNEKVSTYKTYKA